MDRWTPLMNRIANGERILIDGATGTEIERRGVPQLDNAWNGGGALSEPDILRDVHEDYLRAGAEVVIANTFATHRHALRDAGVEDQFEALNRRGVEIAIEARDKAETPHALVAGGLSYWRWLDGWPDTDELPAATREQAAIMASAGADLLMLEMMSHLDLMAIMLPAARTSGLPVWVGLSCKADSDGKMVLYRDNTPLREALAFLSDQKVPLINIMHTEVHDVARCLDVVDKHWSGPVGVYAHSATWIDNVTQFEGTIPPNAYAGEARTWLDRGVQVIGGCCGLGVEHIKALRPLVA